MVSLSAETMAALHGLCRPAQMMLLDAQVQALFDALCWYKASPRGADDQLNVMSQITMADAAVRAIWGDLEIVGAAREIDDVLATVLAARSRAVGLRPEEEPPCSL